MLFTNSFTADFLAVTIALLSTIIVYYKWSFTYWKRKNVTTPPPTIPIGNMASVITGKQSFGDFFHNYYNHLKQQNLPYGGGYFITQKFFVLADIELVKTIMQKDFQYFMNHGSYVNEKDDPLTGNLFSLRDAKWKNMRVKLTPTFTSGKMKMMFETLANCTVDLVENIQKFSEGNAPVDIKEILACFSTDIISSCAFGIESNTQQNPDSDFRKYGKKFFETDVLTVIRNFMQFALPNSVLEKLHFKKTNQKVEDFFIKMVRDTVNYREKNNIFRKDFMHLLIQLKNMGKVTDDDVLKEGTAKELGLSLNEVAAQAFAFFLAGFETSSTTMTFALYEIALSSEIQRKMREEIRTVLGKFDNKICYDAVAEMHYMEKVIQETLRKYPPLTALTRECNKDYNMSDHNLIIEKGTVVIIPAKGIQHDHEYYPNPQVFDPERFSEEAKSSRPSYTWLPFGEGPRMCIGLRFGMMQTKVGLASLLWNFDIAINRKTSIPLIFDNRSKVLSSKNGVWLNFTKIEK